MRTKTRKPRTNNLVWSKWFAWRPVQLDEPECQKGPWVWLEYIERKRTKWHSLWFYRDIECQCGNRCPATEDCWNA